MAKKEKVTVMLGATLPLPGYSSVRIEVSASNEDPEAAYSEARDMFYKFGARHTKELMEGCAQNMDTLGFFQSKSSEEPS